MKRRTNRNKIKNFDNTRDGYSSPNLPDYVLKGRCEDVSLHCKPRQANSMKGEQMIHDPKGHMTKKDTKSQTTVKYNAIGEQHSTVTVPE